MSVLQTAGSALPLPLWGDYVVPVSSLTRRHPDLQRSSQSNDEIHAHLLHPYEEKLEHCHGQDVTSLCNMSFIHIHSLWSVTH